MNVSDAFKEKKFVTQKESELLSDIEETLKEIVETFEDWAEHYPYLDEYHILVLEQSTKPIIIMNPNEFWELEKKVLGNG